ncbi:extracellular solute-binding protein [Ectothiorhodospiraceae bacterium BW-2]|nr:extracellular solute-binding protein [Ectothiorhodospiraceae bacterium BW-2]
MSNLVKILLLASCYLTTATATDIKFSCTSAGCEPFFDASIAWATAHGHTLVPYQSGRLADNLLGLYRQVLSTRSDEFDIMLIDTVWPGALESHLIDFKKIIPQSQLDSHFKPIIDNLTTADGRLIAMPLFTDAGVLYYRKDLLQKYGFAPPKTWGELKDIALAIMAKENNPDLMGYVWQGKGYEGLTCNALEWIDSHHGGTFIDASGNITVNNRATETALAMARDWIGTLTPVEVLNS